MPLVRRWRTALRRSVRQGFLQQQFLSLLANYIAFEEWHSALEMKLYLHRFIHHIGGLPDLSALKFTKYNQYESLILPLYKWLSSSGMASKSPMSISRSRPDASRPQASTG
ncbi:oleate hydratase [Bradyrhizobium barranii]|uniref:oleate hydratase n=1 Tax=Bradyrhizobium barranii TaxID=2992140 RepID=UPI002AAF2E98|nr:oleate hydratase [Bradyrhizobium barranii]